MDSAARIAQKMAALADMGFERVGTSPLVAESIPVSGNRHKVTCRQPSMGTLVSITAVHESSERVQEAAGLAFQEMERVVNLLNRYDSSSALSYLNSEGSIQGPPPELTAVLGEARSFHETTAGAFDPTVQPLVDLFRTGPDGESSGSSQDLGHPRTPTEAEIHQALSLVDGTRVAVTDRFIRLENPGMGVTLDGIAKGFVVDRMAAVLGEENIQDFLINAGGDIRTGGVRDDGQAWRVGVQDPRKEGDLPDVIALSGGAVATSGSYEIYYDRDRVHHHIISAKTGRSPQTSQSVSVVAPTAMAADALATSVFVMEPDRGTAFIESFSSCACLIVDEKGRQWRSKDWRSATDLPTSKAGIS
jgi:thiamine biosynthesis lipoprotein